jgi:hypothetical protein
MIEMTVLFDELLFIPTPYSIDQYHIHTDPKLYVEYSQLNPVLVVSHQRLKCLRYLSSSRRIVEANTKISSFAHSL